MIKILTLIIGLLIINNIGINSGIRNISAKETESICNSYKAIDEHVKLLEFKKLNSLTLENYLLSVGAMESSNNPDTVNTYGYMGEWQFGKAALKDVGYGHIKLKDFKKNPNIFNRDMQKDAMIKYMKLNKKRLNKYIKKYKGRKINGIEITESGILAAAHLAGAGGVKRFLRTSGKYNPQDGYGTQLTKYLKKFSNYNFNLEYV